MKTLLVVCLTLSACAVTTGVVPMGGGSYSVMRRDNGPMASLGALKAAAYRDAAAFCTGQGKTGIVTKSNDVPRSFGQFPETEVQFTCV